ncbi:MAG: extracellular solute-binding protein [Phycisphaerales bacterium]|nr:extracellular solute-binding protein [Phycisphaerales bacterium]
MSISRWLPLVLIVVILGVPFAMRRGKAGPAGGEERLKLIVITPHVTQIRAEFARGFDAWHRREFGEGVKVDFRTPGGTSEIIKQLAAQYTAAFRRGDVVVEWEGERPRMTVRPGSMDVDVMFGGGSYDHGRLKSEVKLLLEVPGSADPVTGQLQKKEFTLAMSEPAGFSREQLDAWYGENAIGAERLYDPDQYWLGTALSSFGIVYNRDVLRELGLGEPTAFTDMADPRLAGWVALADPRQSGSITTTLDAVLSGLGWERGWRLLREMSANSRYFTNVSTKPPIDVGQGECAIGLAIDFYGRGQAQAIDGMGSDPAAGRVGYVDPAGSVYVDADPVSILAGGPSPELARRFLRFVLSEEGQAIWQFPSRADPRSAGNPPGPDGAPMGPAEYELRRMPARRVMYEKYSSSFIDRVNPFELASRAKPAGWRRGIPIMMGAFGIDTGHELRDAWRALNAARGEPTFPRATLDEMERLFYAFPEHEMADGTRLAFTAENYKAIEGAWKSGAMELSRAEIAYRRFFRDNYRKVVELSGTAAIGGRSAGR